MLSTAAPLARISQAMVVTLPPVSLAHLARRGFQPVELAAADDELGAKREKRRAIAAPRPEPPPVTRMRLFLSRPVSNIV